MLLGTSLLLVLPLNSCLSFVMTFFWPLFYLFSCAQGVTGLYAGNTWNECQNMLSCMDLPNPAHLDQEDIVLQWGNRFLSVFHSGEKWEFFMGFVKSSWKRKRNVGRLEKGINNISIHSNKLKRKLMDSEFFITEIRFKLAIGLVQRWSVIRICAWKN